MPDYRKILAAYIDHVAAVEGSDFLSSAEHGFEELSPEERAALIEVRDEVRGGSRA